MSAQAAIVALPIDLRRTIVGLIAAIDDRRQHERGVVDLRSLALTCTAFGIVIDEEARFLAYMRYALVRTPAPAPHTCRRL